MPDIEQQAVIDALKDIAATLERNPSSVTGVKIVARGDGKGGDVTGLSISVSGGAGSGDVTGMKVSVSSGDRNPADIALIQAINDTVQALGAGDVDRSRIDELLKRARDLGNRALNTVIGAAAEAAIRYFLGPQD